MEDVKVVLNNGIPCLAIKSVRPGLGIATCETESSAAADNRYFPDGGEHHVPPQQADGTAIVFLLGESHVEDYRKPNLLLV
uniref:Uncharacterized protein n=1 Tax=Cajanus cajan TaxID=3821 RepID=A0A151TU85_CAJCA|nr:hypothetical protein KK1_009866 [Cajanus cajan]